MTDSHTARLESALAGRYKIQRKLGEGGMASVYLAEDVKHERNVALKILKPELAAVIGAERFLAEIKTTANLQHPHILPLFDSGEADSFLYYVMPYIEGETLRDRVEREGQLGVDEAVRIARDVADALDYAHRNDIIHRDIKPANILLHDGRPVVADFGIALAISAAGGGRMTETGLSLGTPHYMSPEQASADRDLSARSDVYSLGCVLYEMLAGQPPHTGPSAQSILVRILTEDPRDVTELRRTVPPNVAAVVMKSIEKLPADRFDTARQFMDALEDQAFTYRRLAAEKERGASGAPASTAASTTRRGLVAAVAVLAATTLGFGWLAFARPEGADGLPPPVTAFVIEESYGGGAPPVVGPDGSVVFPSDGMLHLRAPGQLEAVPLAGTEQATFATFSPDGRWLAFGGLDQDGLRRMPASGGPVSTVWQGRARYGDWEEDGYFYLETSEAVLRVPENGGAADTLLTIGTHRAPSFVVLPGGKGVALTIGASPIDPFTRIVLLDLSTRDTTTLVTQGFEPRYVPGHLLYAHNGALYAMPFDVRALRPKGPGVPVLDDLSTLLFMFGRYDVTNGMLAYVQGAAVGGEGDASTQFALAEPGGSFETLPLDAGSHPDPGLSPDGRRLAYVRDDRVWVFDRELGSNRPLNDQGVYHNPTWSPGGDEIAYEVRTGEGLAAHIQIQPADGSSPGRSIGGTDFGAAPSQWLPDGTILFHTTGSASTLQDVYRIPSSGGQPEPLLQADWRERNATVSPDGRWIAFVSDERGRAEVHLRRWPDLTQRIIVETPGVTPATLGSHLVWMDDRTLYFRANLQLWEARLSSDYPPVVTARNTGSRSGRLWAKTPEGQLLHWLDVNVAEPDEAPPRLVVVTNWLTALRARLGEGGAR